MDLCKKCILFVICVIILIKFTVTNGVRFPNRRDKKCPKIRNFQGGDVVYFGERNVYSQVFYSCNDAFSLVPSHVDFSVCDENLKWNPVPAKCYKKATLQLPDNGYISEGKKSFLRHLESFKVCCNQGYEVEIDGVTVTKSCTRIQNVNGVLNPKVKCVAERCDTSVYKQVDVKFKNGSLARTKIPSRTTVFLSCKAGFGFYRYGTPIRPQLKRTCNKGKLRRFPKCQEAMCLFSGYPSNRYTYHREYLSDDMMIAEYQYVVAGQSVEVYCYRTDRFELYVNATNIYPQRFTSECRYGQLDKKKEDFPICIEKGCEFQVSDEGCFRIDDRSSCKPADFKLSSGKSLLMGCKIGSKLYRTENGLAVEANETVRVDCNRGSHNSLEGYKCIPDDLVNILEGQGERFPEELDRVSCRYQILKSSDLCVDPCLIPKIPHGYVEQTLTNDRIEFETDHNTSVTFICEEGFHFELANSARVRSFDSLCYLGTWTNLISSTCIPGCILPNGTTVKDSRNGTPVTDRETFTHGDYVNVTCDGQTDEGVITIQCDNGSWKPEVNCSVTGDDSFTFLDTNVTLESASTDSTSNATKPPSSSSPTPTSTITMTSSKDVNTALGCTLSSDPRYKYKDSEGQETQPGTTVANGTSLTVTCTMFDPYDEYANETIMESTLTTVTCTGKELSIFKLDCEEVKEDKCMNIEHGLVKKENGRFFVTCDVGYTLDATIQEKAKYTCKNEKLQLLHGKKEPICIPGKCTVPYIKDEQISVTNTHGVSLPGGSVVNTDEQVTLDCSNPMLEPYRRKFNCFNGQWIQDDNDSAWKFVNNGTFPKCREAKCEPECENGGTCYTDNSCQCPRGVKGHRCENLLCDKECFTNGGTCDDIGQCECPSGRSGHNCRQVICLFPSNAATFRYRHKKVFEVGETIRNFHCDNGYKLSSSHDVMTCQQDGTWSTVVECLKDLFYRGHRWEPIISKIKEHILFKKCMDLNRCKQLCINMEGHSCTAIYYRPYARMCTGYSVANISFFRTRIWNWSPMVYLRNW